MEAHTVGFDPYRKWLGIPAKDLPPNHYRLLGIELFESDADVIEHAADQRMAHLRSLQTGKHGALSQRILNEIAAAQVCLLNAKSRAAYDAQLRAKLTARDSVPIQRGQAVPTIAPKSPATAAFAGPSFDLGPTRRAPKRTLPSLPIIASAAISIVLLGVAVYVILAPPAKSNSRTSADGTKTAARVAVPEPPAPQAVDARPAPQPASVDPPFVPAASPVNPKGSLNPELPTNAPIDVAIDHSGDPPGELAGDSIDLLKLIDPARNSVVGHWTRQGTALVSPDGLPWARLQVPYKPPPAYELTAVVERIAGHDSITVGLVVGNAQPGAVIDGWGNRMCGLAMIDRRWGDDNETTIHIQNVLQGGQHTILSRVHPDRVEILVDRKKLIDWRGDSHRLAIDRRNPMPNREQLYLVTYLSSYRITTLELKALTPGN
jgi:hypothetical protein